MTRLFLSGALALTLALTACDSNDPIVSSCENESREIAIDTLAVGTSPAVADAGDRVLINYTGTLENGSEFDSGTNSAFYLASTVSGFRQGVTGMRIGGRRRITVPPYLGYGTQAREDASGEVLIPSCSVLVFEVELLDILS